MDVQPLPVCYRHLDRETRLRCSNCGRPVCADCVQFQPEGQRCPECTAPEEDTASGWGTASPSAARTPVSMVLLGASVGVYLLLWLLPDLWMDIFRAGHQSNPAIAEGQWWRPVTASFLHADLTHVLFNMWALYLFGPPLEREAGSAPFAALYFAAVVAGGGFFYALAPASSAIGASGAIFGLFGAWLAAALRNRRDPRGQAGLRQLLFLLAINIALPVFVPQIAWQAHLGGFLAGFVIAWLWGVSSRRGGGVGARTLVAVCVGLASAALLV